MNRYERYKDSGIPWLGEVPEHWDTMSLKYICDVRDGTHDTPQYVYESDNSYPLVTSKDISNGNINFESAIFISEEDYLNISKRSNVNFGDLLMPMIGTVGGSVLVETYRKFTIKNVALFKAGQFCAKWLKYFLDSELSKIQFELEKNGGVQDFVGLTTLRNLIILKLPLKEQTAIAHYLDTKLGEIDALIDKQQTLLEKLAEQRTAVITHAVTKGLNPAAPMKKSGVEWLGDVPAHWNVSYLKFYYEVQLGKMLQPKSNNTDDFEISYFKAFHVQWNNIMTEELPLMWVNPSELDKYTVNNGDLLICEGGEVGRCSILRNLDGIAIIQNAVHRVRTLKNSEIRYLDYVIRHIASVGWFNILCNKATIAHLTSEKLINLNIPIPPKDEQINIADYLDQETAKIDRLCDTVNQTIGRLKEYRTALITQAVTGKIKVTNE